MYISVGDLRPRSTSNSETRALAHLVLFYFWSLQQPFLPPPLSPHIDRALDSACLALMRLFCAIQLIPLRERQADGGGKGRDGRLIRLVASEYGRRNHFTGIFSSCIIELINTCYTDTRNRSTFAGIVDTTRIVHDAIAYHRIGDSITQRTAHESDIIGHRFDIKWNRREAFQSLFSIFLTRYFIIRDIEFLQQCAT